MKAVLEYERTEGRSAKRMGQTHPGFDILSSNAAGEPERYIEVKSISADWSEGGVTLSQPQFTAAQTLKDKFWLYVVERANSGTTVDSYPKSCTTRALVYFRQRLGISRRQFRSEQFRTVTVVISSRALLTPLRWHQPRHCWLEDSPLGHRIARRCCR